MKTENLISLRESKCKLEIRFCQEFQQSFTNIYLDIMQFFFLFFFFRKSGYNMPLNNSKALKKLIL